MIKRLVDKIKNSEFVRNAATLATGTTIAQIISIGTAPIVYRIYSKIDYGTLGLYMAIVGVIGVFSTMQFTQIILLEKDDEQSKVAMWLNRYINSIFTGLVFLFVLVFQNYIGHWANNELITPWLFLIPISIFFGGQNEIFRVWANRKKEYKLLTINSVIVAVSVPVFSITIGLLHKGPLGLFIGLVASQVIPTVVLMLGLRSKYDMGPRGIRTQSMVAIAKRNYNFPLYTLPSEFINRFTNQLPVFMISKFLGPATVGVYNLCVRMLGLPISLITNAISEVFRQRATNDYNQTGSCRPIFKKTFKTLSLISILPIIIILAFGPDIFAFGFGEKWRMAGQFARILIIMYTGKLIVSPLSYMFIIAKRLQEDFILHIYFLVSNLVIFQTLGQYSIFTVLILYSVNYLLIYTYTVYRSYVFSVNKKWGKQIA